MSSAIYTMLSTELTCIPSSMERIIGSSFNNTLCNGVTWLFATLFVLHSCYNKLLNVYLKQIGFIPYQRIRLVRSLWLLAFCVSFFFYYLITVDESGVWCLINVKKDINARYEEVPTEKIVVYAIIYSFFLHMAYDHGVRLSSLHSVVKFGSLLVVYNSAYTLRYLDIPFTLTALMAVSGILEELSKIFYSLLDKGSKLSSVFMVGLFISSVVVSCTIYFVVIPLTFLIPLGKMVLFANSSLTEKTLFSSLLCWLNFSIYKSVLLNSIFHWLYHRKTLSENEEDEHEKDTLRLGCLGNIIECSLFPPRSDEGFMLAFLRYEIKMRQKRMIAKRKPKNRNMLLQTLKCMVAIKRKLSEKRSADSGASESDDGDEVTERDQLIKDENDTDQSDEDTIQMKRSEKMMRFSDVLVRTIDYEETDEATEVEIQQGDEEDKENNGENVKDDEVSESKEEHYNKVTPDREPVDVGESINVGSIAESIIAETLEGVLKNEEEVDTGNQKEFGGDTSGCGNGKCKSLK